ncbi:nucleoside phosphorylase [Winogradskyella immobilis]|uniref:Nucleoside phosphorylase n=1 Tax=Winogradskyella immobilis TaxID=2816852 RepID=A0ABS8EPK6_9FLAO|nr:nucleoside phosphorylase [Winogradskyella immobilis]MCC1485098.1 nucleoside phosphorylase [Winogradskyella immobilis]MCG0017190.1 nucleoside phosphorylase [Winogradskyella immobilis]
MPIKDSELILNSDGSIYHLNLRPKDIADTIITVGDPDRVDSVTKYFDSIRFRTKKREFHTQTGTYKNKPITVISTGIGTDNIDIVFNELDALVNIDLKTRTIKPQLKSLDIIRIGTSGSIQKAVPIDSFLISEYAVGFDSLLHFYNSGAIQQKDIAQAIIEQTEWYTDKSSPYVVACDAQLYSKLSSDKTYKGFTATNAGFYGPQGRVLRLSVQDNKLNDKLTRFNYNGISITNLEMETAGIYGLSKLLGHRALSMNAIIANRATGQFSTRPLDVVDHLIRYTLNKLVE